MQTMKRVQNWLLALTLALLAPLACALGNGDGIYGSYYNCGAASTATVPCVAAPTMTRIDTNINFTWDGAEPYNSNGVSIASSNFQVVWTGSLYTPTQGNYDFYVKATDGVRIYINGTLLTFYNGANPVDSWQVPSTSTQLTATVSLNADSYNTIEVDYRSYTANSANVNVQWDGPGITMGVIGANYLFSNVSRGGDGLFGSYYGDNLSNTANAFTVSPCDQGIGGSSDWKSGTAYAVKCVPTFTRVDPTIDLDLTWPIAGQSNCNPPDPTSMYSVAPCASGTYWGAVWTGELMAPETGDYTFQLTFDDGVYFFIEDDQQSGLPSNPSTLRISNWGPAATSKTATVFMTAGKKYLILLEYRQVTGTAQVDLQWEHPGAPNSFTDVPVDFLYSNSSPTLQGAGSVTCALGPRMQAYFSQVMDPVSTQNTANYTVTDTTTGKTLGVTGAALSADGTMVNLTLSTALVAGNVYKLSVSSLKNLEGNTMSASSDSFTAAAIAHSNGVVGDYFDQRTTPTGGQVATDYFNSLGYGGTSRRIDPYIDFWWEAGSSGKPCSPYSDATSGDYHAPHDAVGPVPTMSIPAFTAGGSFTYVCANYSTRWFGQVYAPETGFYNFRTESDDGVRLIVDDQLLVNNMSPHTMGSGANSGTGVLNNSSIWMQANTWYDLRMEYFNRTNQGIAALSWALPSSPGTNSIVPNADLQTCSLFDHLTVTPVGGNHADVCTGKQFVIQAFDINNNPDTGFTGAVQIYTSDNGGKSNSKGTWTLVSGKGTLDASTSNNGYAVYTFVSADMGQVTLSLLNNNADDVVVTAVAEGQPTSAGSSPTVSFSYNAFGVYGTNGAKGMALDPNYEIAGYPQPFTIDPRDYHGVGATPPNQTDTTFNGTSKNTGGCSNLASYTGTKNLRMWLTPDPNYGTAAPLSLATPPSVVYTVNGVTTTLQLPKTEPPGNNVALSFAPDSTGKVTSSVSLTSSDVGAYSLNVRDTDTPTGADNKTAGVSDFYGVSDEFYLRPFYLMVTGPDPYSHKITSASPASAVEGLLKSGESSSDLVTYAALTAGTDFSLGVNAYVYPSTNPGLLAKLINPSSPYQVSLTALVNDLESNQFVSHFSGAATSTSGLYSYSTNFSADSLFGVHPPNCQSCEPITVMPAQYSLNSTAGPYNGSAILEYPEVGFVRIGASVSNYLNSGQTVSSVGDPWIGRFKPAGYIIIPSVPFSPSVVSPWQNCRPSRTLLGYNYIGEWYNLNFKLQAVNVTGAASTQYSFPPYDTLNGLYSLPVYASGNQNSPSLNKGVFLLHTAPSPGYNDVYVDFDYYNNGGTLSQYPVSWIQGTSSSSPVSLYFRLNIDPEVKNNVAVAPYPYSTQVAGTGVGITVKDGDKVGMYTQNFGPEINGSLSSFLLPTVLPPTVLLGRTKLVNTYGSASAGSSLSMPVRLETYGDYTLPNNGGKGWQLNGDATQDNNCDALYSNLEPASGVVVNISPPTSSCSTTNGCVFAGSNLYLYADLGSNVKYSDLTVIGATDVVNATFQLKFSAPTTSGVGGQTLKLVVPDFLQFDWLGMGCAVGASNMCNPTANLTFGVLGDQNAGTNRPGHSIFQSENH